MGRTAHWSYTEAGNPLNQNQIALGGGCHWCTEAVFLALRGVVRVEQGFVSSCPPNETFSEAIIVTFDPEEIVLADLVNIHLLTHSSTSQHSMRGKYRSAIYFFTPEQERDVRAILQNLQNDFTEPLVTSVSPFLAFKASHDKYRNYFEKNPDRPFCKRYIDPKLDKLRAEYTRFVKDT